MIKFSRLYISEIFGKLFKYFQICFFLRFFVHIFWGGQSYSTVFFPNQGHRWCVAAALLHSVREKSEIELLECLSSAEGGCLHLHRARRVLFGGDFASGGVELRGVSLQ